MPTLRERVRYSVQRLKARLGALLLGRASRKRRGLSGRLCSWLLALATNSSRSKSKHRMRDELVDAHIEFDPHELAQYQQRASRREDEPHP
jgi:hypothetical protein